VGPTQAVTATWETYIVSKAVGNVRNNGAELVEPVDVTDLEQQERLQL
jgi:hypothetical protein